MTSERIAELRDLLSNAASVGPQLVLECLDEIERLDNITRIQQEQISRLLTARDAEKWRADKLEAKLSDAESRAEAERQHALRLEADSRL